MLLSKERIDAGIIGFSDNVFGGAATLDEASGAAELCVHLVGIVDVETSDSQGNSSFPAPVLLVPSLLFDRAFDLLGCVDTTLDANYGIAAGSRSYTDGQDTFTLEWTRFVPTQAPNAQTEG